MIYVLGILGIGGVILLLLWRLEVAKRKRAEQALGIEKANTTNLREIIKEERRLQKAAEVDRLAIRHKIDELENKVLSAEPGEEVTDIFGTGGKEGEDA